MTPAERKNAARKELARRELARRGADIPQDATIDLSKQPFAMDEPYAADVHRRGVGQAEALMSVLSGTGAATTGQIGGGIQALLNPNQPLAGPQARDRITEALTYQPRGEEGQQVMQGMGEIMAPVSEAIESTRLHEEAAAAGLPEWVQRLGAGTPEYASAVLSMLGLRALQPKAKTVKVDPKTGDLSSGLGKKSVIESELRAGRPSEKTAGFKLQGGQLTKDALQKTAVKKGWAPKTVSWVAHQPKNIRAKMRNMVDTAEDYFTRMDADMRPSDWIGDSVSEQAAFVNATRSRAGRVMDTVANGQLAKQNIYIAKLRSDFHVAVRGLRGMINKNGDLSFSQKSKISSSPGDMRALQELQNKLKAYGSKPTGQELHEFKQWAADQISFGKSALTKEDGISAGVEKIINNARREANNALRKVSKPYAKANDIYSETKSALDTMQKGAGNVDMFGEGAESALGVTMRRLLGNAQSRQNVSKGVKMIQQAAKKYGGEFPDENFTAQMKFVDEMERLWGPFTETSFKAESGNAAARVLQNPSVIQTGREMVDLSVKQLRKLSQNRESQLKALKELLYEGGE